MSMSVTVSASDIADEIENYPEFLGQILEEISRNYGHDDDLFEAMGHALSGDTSFRAIRTVNALHKAAQKADA